tara:strand:+ start:250524 stop:251261 length:738 start_codon:yes stop_codon:yes gene_type:complete
MTNPNYTHIEIILDRSGSMGNVWSDTLGGLNHLLEDQKKIEGKATVSLRVFDHEYETLFEMSPLAEVQKITNEMVHPRGGTALLDAVGRTTTSLGAHLSGMKEEERPGNVIVAILTDGYENASKEFTSTSVQTMVKDQEDKYSWNFIYIGADVNDFANEAVNLGIKAGNALRYTKGSVGNSAAYNALGGALRMTRSLGTQGQTVGSVAFYANAGDAENVDDALIQHSVAIGNSSSTSLEDKPDPV